MADGLGGLDLLVHSIAFAQAHDLEGRFTDTQREDYLLALDVSSYSLVAMTRRAEPLMRARGGGSIVTMTYLGGERAVPHYNVMGVAKAALESSMRYLAADLGEADIRVNAISAGPVRTLSARSITGLHDDGVDRRRAGAAQAQHRRVRRRLGRAVPALAARVVGHRDDPVRRLGLPRDGDVEQQAASVADPGMELSDPTGRQHVMVSARSDASVIAASLAEPDRFAEIFDRHFATVFRFAERRVGRDQAAEVASETLARAFAKRGSFRPEALDALPWLLGIASKLILHERRRFVRYLAAVGRASVEIDTVDPDGGVGSVDRRLDAPAEWARMRAALLTLADADRELPRPRLPQQPRWSPGRRREARWARCRSASTESSAAHEELGAGADHGVTRRRWPGTSRSHRAPRDGGGRGGPCSSIPP